MKAHLVSALAFVLLVLFSLTTFAATHNYVDFDTVYVIYTHYKNGSTQVSFSEDQINTILASINALQYWCWRSSNCMCNQQFDLTEYDPADHPDGDLLYVRSTEQGGHTLSPDFNRAIPPPLDFEAWGFQNGGTQLNTENFQNGTLDSWSNASGDDIDWTINTGYTPTGSQTGNTGPSGESPYGGDSYYAYFEADDANQSGDEAILESPNIGGTGTRVLEFDYHMYGSDIGALYVDVYDGSQWDEGVWSRTGQQHTGPDDIYKGAQVILSSYTGTIRLRFRAVAAGGSYGDIAIDHIRVHSGKLNLFISDERVAYDLEEAGLDPSSYSCLFVFYPFQEDSEFYTVYFGGTMGVQWTHDWGDGGFIGLVLQPWDWSEAIDGVMQFEWNNYMFSVFNESGLQTAENPTYFPDPEATHLCNLPIDCMWDFRFQSMGNPPPAQWLALDTRWAIDRYATDNDNDGIPDSGDFAFTDASLGTSGSSDYDGDELSDIEEMSAEYHGSSDPDNNQDSDDDGTPDGSDPFPLYATSNLDIAQGAPTIDGTLDGGGVWTEVAHVGGTDYDLNATIYAAWDDGVLYIAVEVNDDDVDADAGASGAEAGDDLLQLLVDNLADGWRNLGNEDDPIVPSENDYILRFAPDGSTGDTEIFGYERQSELSEGHDLTEMSSASLDSISSEFSKTSTTYFIEAEIPETAMNNATFEEDASLRLAFAFQDVDGGSVTPPEDVYTGSLWSDASEMDPGCIEIQLVAAGPDTTPPSPNPMTWATVPYATGSTSISMTATTATDDSGVEYSFDCTAGGGHDSGWQDSSTYQDTNLSPSTQYSYRVMARDKSTNQNETGYSSTQSATTQAGGGGGDVEIIGSWTTSTSSHSHAKESGTDRLLVFTIHCEDSDSTALNASAATYGGQSMTKVIDRSYYTPSGEEYVVVFVLKETGINAASGTSFGVTWTGGSPSQTAAFSSVFLQNVDQSTSIGASASNYATTGTVTTSSLSTADGDMVLVAGTNGNTGTGSAYQVNNGFTEPSIELEPVSADGVVGYKAATGANETPSITHTNVNRQVIAGVVVKHD